MARLGRKAVALPAGVSVAVEGATVSVAGPKGKLSCPVPDGFLVRVEDGRVFIENTVPQEQRKLFRKSDALHGMLRTLIRNMVQGVHEGFEKVLEIHGVGYKAEVKGKTLSLTLGFTHPVDLPIPAGVAIEVLRNTMVFLRSHDRELLGRFAATVRDVCPPEPYKGKGIRYRGEYVRQKVGKTAVGVTK